MPDWLHAFYSHSLAFAKHGNINLIHTYSRACISKCWSIRDEFIGERAKRARHSQVCSIENRIYIYILLWYVQNFVLITRKEGGA